MMDMGNMQEMMKKSMEMMGDPTKMMGMMQDMMKNYVNPDMWQDFMKKYMDMWNGFMNMGKK